MDIRYPLFGYSLYHLFLFTFVQEKIFSEKCFEPEHPLVNGGRVVMPDGVRRDQFLGWIEQLADRQVNPELTS